MRDHEGGVGRAVSYWQEHNLYASVPYRCIKHRNRRHGENTGIETVFNIDDRYHHVSAYYIDTAVSSPAPFLHHAITPSTNTTTIASATTVV